MGTIEKVEGTSVIRASRSVETHGLFDAGTKSLASIADVAKKRGLKVTALSFGVLVLMAVVGEFLSSKDYVPNHGEMAALILGGILIIVPIILNELGYKWEISADIRKRELVVERLRIEADYQVARLEATQLRRREQEDEQTSPTRPT